MTLFSVLGIMSTRDVATSTARLERYMTKIVTNNFSSKGALIYYSHSAIVCSYIYIIYTLYRVFFHWYPPKKLKYGKPRLGESTAT